MTWLLVTVLLFAACGPAPEPSVPFDEGVPANGHVIYTAPHSRVGFYGYPIRIVQIGEQCVTEDYENQHWQFVSAAPCAPSASMSAYTLGRTAEAGARGTGRGNARSQATRPGLGAVLPSLSGIASWYDAPTIHDAAAGPPLRVGNWRGRLVTVRYGSRSVVVRLSDFCACPKRLIDLDDKAFKQLAPLSVGLLRVTITTGGPALPATDAP